jgi:hypothetical protein
VTSDEPNPTVDLVLEVGGITVTVSVLADDVPKILAWSTSEVILHLGSEGPLLQEGLREIFGS